MNYFIAGAVGLLFVLLWEISSACKGCLSELKSIVRELQQIREQAELAELNLE